ncbi:MAG: M23 family metallopeptidase [Acidobacteria bacterium]|nr:M23 family metallopeptidase [Acidobacteriota bacterium]
MMCLYLLMFASPPEWQWPIDTQHGLTATFAEYRSDHFHTGLDFSTAGKEGLAIHAAANGRVFKVRAQERGYGKSIYIRHSDGWITVYAHLAAFGPKITDAITSAGYDPSQIFGTLTLELDLSARDLLAYSGESGAGLPHLHFEVRDRNNRPVDPLTLAFPPLNLSVQTELEYVTLAPLNAKGKVNGQPLPTRISKFPAHIQASGKMALALAVAIRDESGNTLGPRSLTVQANGQVIKQWHPIQIDFEHYTDAGSIFDQAHSGFGNTRYVYCFDERTNRMPGWISEVLDVTSKTILHIEVGGIQGTKQFELTLDPQAPVSPWAPVIDKPSIQATSFMINGWLDQISIGVSVDGTLMNQDLVTALTAGEQRLFQVTAPPVPWTWRTDSGGLSRWIGALPGKSQYTCPIGDFTLTYEAKEPLPDMLVWLEPADPRIQQDALNYLSPVIRFAKEGYPTGGLSVSTPRTKPNSGFFAWSYTRGKWVYWQTTDEQVLRAGVDYSVPLVIAQDTAPPTIGRPKTHNYFSGRRKVVPVRDLGSGILWSDITIAYQTRVIKPETDPDRGWVLLEENWDDAIQITVSDRLGNTASATFQP